MAARIVRSMRKVAAHYGVADSTVYKDWKSSGMPGVKGRYDLDAIDAWRATRNTSKDRTGTLTASGRTAVANPPEIEDEDKVQLSLLDEASSAKLRSLKADAQKKEADARIKHFQALRIENNDIVDLDRVEAFLTELFAEARKQLLRVPQKMRRFGDDAVKACRQEIELRLHGIRKVSDRLSDLREDL